MFTTLIVQPIFNILTLIYALIPGHNFGIAIILFTFVARFAFYPLLKKQLRHTKAMKSLQPELKKIKAKTKGDKKEESAMMMELYKEREIKPMSFMLLMVIQIVLFLALFAGLNKVVNDPQAVYTFSYPQVQSFSTMQAINEDPTKFDNTLVGGIDLTRAAITKDSGFYLPAFIMVLGSAVVMFFQIRQTSPNDGNARKLRDILKDASDGKQADSSEMNAVMARNISFVMPIFIFVISIGFPAALALYWFTGNLIGYLQQYRLLKQDEFALTTATVVSKKPLRSEPKEAEIVKEKPKKKKKSGGVVITTYTAPSAGKPKSKSARRSKSNKRRR